MKLRNSFGSLTDTVLYGQLSLALYLAGAGTVWTELTTRQLASDVVAAQHLNARSGALGFLIRGRLYWVLTILRTET